MDWFCGWPRVGFTGFRVGSGWVHGWYRLMVGLRLLCSGSGLVRVGVGLAYVGF